MRVLVTGKNGFISRHLIKRLESEHNVRGVGRVTPEEMVSVLFQFKPEIIYHLGAELKNSHDMFEANVVLTHTIIDWCKSNPVTRLVLFGSSSEYGFTTSARSEKQLPLPTNMYEGTKAATAMLARGAAHQYNIPTLFIRPFTIYGEDEKPTKLTQILFQKMKDGTTLKLTDGVHDYMYIDDFVDILLQVVSSPKLTDKFTLLNIGTGVQTTNIQFVNMFQEVTGHKFTIEIGNCVWPESWVAETTQLEYKFDINLRKAKDLENGIRRMVGKYHRNGVPCD
jgi:UDP-glucuronate 4-epimerase